MMRYCVLLQSGKKKKIRKERKNKCEVTYNEVLRPPAERKKNRKEKKSARWIVVLHPGSIASCYRAVKYLFCLFKYIFVFSNMYLKYLSCFVKYLFCLSVLGFHRSVAGRKLLKKKSLEMRGELWWGSVLLQSEKKKKKKKKNARWTMIMYCVLQ